MFIRTPTAAPLPGDVRQREDGRLERYDTDTGWTDRTLSYEGQWNEWTVYRSGDVVDDLHDLGGCWVCTDAEADTWSCIALPARELWEGGDE